MTSFRLALAFVLSVATATASPDLPVPQTDPGIKEPEFERGPGWRRYGKVFIFSPNPGVAEEADYAMVSGASAP